MGTTETKHATTAIMGAISKSHGLTDAQIHARIRSVDAAVRAGLTVKTLASDMARAAASGLSHDGTPITAESQQTLGRARNVVVILDKIGVSLATADRVTVANVYRAISRHGVTPTTERLVPVGVDAGKDPAEKLAAVSEVAETMVAESISERKSSAGKPRAKGDALPGTFDQRVRVLEKSIRAMTTDLRTSPVAMTADARDSLGRAVVALMAELQAMVNADAPASKPVPSRKPIAA